MMELDWDGAGGEVSRPCRQVSSVDVRLAPGDVLKTSFSTCFSWASLGPGIDGRGILRGPRATRMGTGLS